MQCILETRKERTFEQCFINSPFISSAVCREIRQKEKDEELQSSGTGICRFIIYFMKAGQNPSIGGT